MFKFGTVVIFINLNLLSSCHLTICSHLKPANLIQLVYPVKKNRKMIDTFQKYFYKYVYTE